MYSVPVGTSSTKVLLQFRRELTSPTGAPPLHYGFSAQVQLYTSTFNLPEVTFFCSSAILWPVLCSFILHHCFYCGVPSTSNSTPYGRKFTSHLCQIKSKPLTFHKGVHPFCSIEQKFIALDWFLHGNANRFSFPLPSLYCGPY